MKKNFARSPYAHEQLTPSERQKRIHELEVKRLSIVREIEQKMQQAAHAAKDPSLGKRASSVGRASNDYRPMK